MKELMGKRSQHEIKVSLNNNIKGRINNIGNIGLQWLGNHSKETEKEKKEVIEMVKEKVIDKEDRNI